MTKARGLLIVGLLLCGTPAFAGPLNLSFESGLSPEWTTLGIVTVESAASLPEGIGLFDVNPTNGTKFALLKSGDDQNISAGTSDLEAFFGMSAGTLSSFGGGSGLKRNFDLGVGDMWSFDFNFVAGEDNPALYNDAALFVMNDGILVNTIQLSDVAEVGGFGSTGWVPYSFTATAAGNYLIGVGIFNRPSDDNTISSYLAVDNFQVIALEGQEPPPTSVPEPATLLLLTAGWGTAFVSKRYLGGRKERKQKETL